MNTTVNREIIEARFILATLMGWEETPMFLSTKNSGHMNNTHICLISTEIFQIFANLDV